MRKISATIHKELLLLIRDKAGLAILFLMPMALILIMVLIQDISFRVLVESRIAILLVNEDRGEIGDALEEGLQKSNLLTIVKQHENNPVTRDLLKYLVASGEYHVGILIPEGTTDKIRGNIQRVVIQSATDTIMSDTMSTNALVRIYTDPAVKLSVKNSLISILREYTARLEGQILIRTVTGTIAGYFPNLSGLLNTMNLRTAALLEGREQLLQIEEIIAAPEDSRFIPNAVQHNVPAWTMFAMFFIVIPLSGSIIKERDEGNLSRLLAMPVSYPVVIGGKIVIYMAVCFIQFLLMIGVGLLILPLFGLPVLQMGTHPSALILIVFSSALAATGYGMILGALARTHHQASSFGAISVIIAAALGGIWVPVFMMPDIMQHFSALSPLAWGLSAFHDAFLRDAGPAQVLADSLKLILFSLFTMTIAFVKFKVTRK